MLPAPTSETLVLTNVHTMSHTDLLALIDLLLYDEADDTHGCRAELSAYLCQTRRDDLHPDLGIFSDP